MKVLNYIVTTAYDNINELNRPIRNIDILIQAGAALTPVRVGDFQDNTGDNISEKNRQYCELTALYWIWKNQTADYYGLEHYRRAFTLNDSEILDILSQGVDAIIPKKIVMSLSVEEQYYINACNDTWDVMMEVLKKRDTFVYECAKIVFSQNILFPLNMGFFSHRFLNDYCSWLFPILEEVESICGEKWDVYQNRYPGFLSERLFTLFYFINCEKYNFYEAPVVMYNAQQQQNLSEDYIIQHTVDLLNARKSFPAYSYLSQDVPSEIRAASPIITNLYELAVLVKDEGLKKGDVYLTRECHTLEDYMAVHHEAFRRNPLDKINVAVYVPDESDFSAIDAIIDIYNSVCDQFSGLPLNVCAIVRDNASQIRCDFNSRMYTDVNTLIHLYRSNMITAVIVPETASGAERILSTLITRGVPAEDLYILKQPSDSCSSAGDIAELITSYAEIIQSD